jgi:CRP/FNR family transcriptional regulator, cyclic AMP receptor protein
VLTREAPVPERETPRGVRLLVADPELGDGISGPELELAQRALVVPLVEGVPGDEASLDQRLNAARPLGFLVMQGLILRETDVAGQGAAELLGAGDVLVPGNRPEADLMPGGESVDWRLLTPIRLAILDAAFLQKAARWPQVGWHITRRTLNRGQASAVQLAICSRPRIEDRLQLLMWHLARRWGRVTRDGVRVELPLTHAVLGKLVGAHRPSVTTALGSLGDRGLVVRDGDGWVLREQGDGTT